MFERAHADALIDTLKQMLTELQKHATDELALQQKLNPSGAPTPITPEGVALLSTRLQIMTLTNAVATIGETLIEVLHDRAQAGELGLE